MRYRILSTLATVEAADCWVVAIFKEKTLSQAAQYVDTASQGYLTRLLQQGDLTEEIGQTLMLHAVPGIKSARVLLVYAGQAEKLTAQDWRKLNRAAADTLKGYAIQCVLNGLGELYVTELNPQAQIQQLITAVEASFYEFNHYKSQPKPVKWNIETLEWLLYRPNAESAGLNVVLERSQHLNAALRLTKDLANQPANVCTPTYMVEQAKTLAKTVGLTCKVLDHAAMRKEGMGALLAVAQGSEQPAFLVTLEYHGAEKNQKPVVLVGKGVTFDSGGICLKPSASMEEMKYDMCGAATVLGVLQAAAQMKLPLNIVGVMALTENLPSGRAVKPGDIVTSLSGQTIEIINTDAEGRLILADALTYSERFDPDVVIDIATLTGAIVVALGDVASGLMSNQAELTQALLQAGEQSGDQAWSLPLWEAYQPQVDSPIADMMNIGIGGAKSITAACFLVRFAKKFHWAHLDIAGTAWKNGKTQSATGRPVSLLVQFLLNRCKN
jgi:leucyl aminopeptidase